MVENQTDRKLKSLRSDNGGEYKSDEFVQFCRERGIRREFTAPHSSEQNGVVERMNRTIQEQIVSMLHQSGLSDGFWAEALLTAVHIINMSPSRPLGSKIPQELWTQRKQDYGKLRIFGCEAYALVAKDDRRKLESWSRKCIFLGYGPEGSFGYRLWDPETRQVVRSSDIFFNESAMHKSTERPIEVRRVMFSDVTAPLDGPAQHTRLATRPADPLDTDGAVSEDHPSSNATIGPTGSDIACLNVRSTTAPEPATPVGPRRSERLSQPPERFSPGLFFTDAEKLSRLRMLQVGDFQWSQK
jgi:hypothetical protein